MLAMSDASIQRLGGPAMLRRAAALCAMLVILVAFRDLALLGVAFVIFSRALAFIGRRLAPLVGGSEHRALIAFLVLLLALVGVGVFSSFRLGNIAYLKLIEGQDIVGRFAALRDDVLRQIPPWVPLAYIKENAPHFLNPAITYVSATGKILFEVLIGLILAAVYLLDRPEVDALVGAPANDTFLGKLRAYFGYLGEAINITIQLQLLVALVNTLLTLPVLLLMGLPHVLALTALIFCAGLIPVIGNFISGAVLILVSYRHSGPKGVVIFLLITFVLHKIEAYYLNPRLTSRHVHLPALVLIVSLIAFEHVFGLPGLFLSFPALYVGIKVAHDFHVIPPPGALQRGAAPSLVAGVVGVAGAAAALPANGGPGAGAMAPIQVAPSVAAAVAPPIAGVAGAAPRAQG